MKHASALSLLSVTIALVACPRTDRTPPVIDTVEKVSSLEVPQFKLNVRGHGFGLSGVTYDLSAGEGVATGSALRMEIRRHNGALPIEITRVVATIVSPTVLLVTVDITAPLPPDTYDLFLFGEGAAEPIAEKKAAFDAPAISGPHPQDDAGMRPADDAAAVGPDAPPAMPGDDAGTGLPFDDAASAVDPDAGIAPGLDAQPADSGLGDFPVGPTFRRAIQLINDTGLASPVDITVRILVPHLAMIAAGESTASGADLAVYLGPTPLPMQIEDRGLLGTDRLELIVRLPIAIAAGPSMNLPLALYSDPLVGAATPTTEAVYLFTEHFDLDFPTFVPGRRDLWNDRWEDDCNDRLRATEPQSRCRLDSEAGLTRRTLASPSITAMSSAPPANERYEVVAFLGGAMQTTNDLLYFSYGPDAETFAATTLLPDGAYDPAFVPNANLTFQETTGANRTARGFRFPGGAGTPFTRMRVSFVPATSAPHLQFRYISADNQTNVNTVVGIDDLVVRRALSPDFRVLLGPAEHR